MKANELRLNNLVQDAKGRVCTVVNLCSINDEIAISAHAKYSAITTLPYQPIPLTEEWLLRFGMEEASNGWWCKDEVFSYREGYAGLGTDRWTQIQHVHQLQNLYFALTGQELTIKEAAR